MTHTEQGAIFPAEGGIETGILDFIKQALSKGCFDAVLISAKTPGGDSFAYLLIQDETLLKDALPICPIMPVQGAKALSSLTRLGKGKRRIAAVMRPCEVRATAELFKLGQVDLENIFLITIDCPGALPLADWVKDPKKAGEVFSEVLKGEVSDSLRPVCQVCDEFSATGGEDLHIGTLGTKSGSIFLIPNSPKGKDILDGIGLSVTEDMSQWQETVNRLTEGRREKRKQAQKELGARVKGLDNLLDTFSECINCHNCMRVCPICYCKLCEFESPDSEYSPSNYESELRRRGGLKVPAGTTYYQLGRLTHISISCVGCGSCEDACPVDIPLSIIFKKVGESVQKMFDYIPGKNIDEEVPLVTFKEVEFAEIEE